MQTADHTKLKRLIPPIHQTSSPDSQLILSQLPSKYLRGIQMSSNSYLSSSPPLSLRSNANDESYYKYASEKKDGLSPLPYSTLSKQTHSSSLSSNLNQNYTLPRNNDKVSIERLEKLQTNRHRNLNLTFEQELIKKTISAMTLRKAARSNNCSNFTSIRNSPMNSYISTPTDSLDSLFQFTNQTIKEKKENNSDFYQVNAHALNSSKKFDKKINTVENFNLNEKLNYFASPPASFTINKRDPKSRSTIHASMELNTKPANNFFKGINRTKSCRPVTSSLISAKQSLWFNKEFTRNYVDEYLKDKEPGTFLVRCSSTKNDMFALGLRVDETKSEAYSVNPVRHFLIERTSNGVRFVSPESNEPYFPSLNALIYQHTLNSMLLPMPLKFDALLREQNQPLTPISPENNGHSSQSNLNSTVNQTAAFKGIYWYMFESGVENLTGNHALNQTVKYATKENQRMVCAECSLEVNFEGILLTDIYRKVFFRHQFTLGSILFVSILNLIWTSAEVEKRGLIDPKFFGLVIRVNCENRCYLFCESNKESLAKSAVDAINGICPSKE